MAIGLNVQDVVKVSISLSAAPAGFRNFSNCMVVGSSSVIDVVERKRIYTGLDGVATDFGTTAPEYLWAQSFFGQKPQPSFLEIARWAQAATPGILHGAALTPAQRLMSAFNAVTAGAMLIVVDGAPYALTGLDFSSATNLNGVATIIQTALTTAGATGSRVIWGAGHSRFDIISGTTGAASTLSYAKAPTAVDRVTFTGQPASGSSIVLNGTTVTFGASAGQVAIGASLSLTLANLLTFLRSSSDIQLLKFSYSVDATHLYLTAATAGTGGNSLTVTASTSPASNATVAVTPMAGGSGVDVSLLLGLSITPNSTGANADPPVSGIVAETALSCISTLGDLFGDWYVVDFAPLSPMSDADRIAVSGYIEGATQARICAATSQNTTAYDSTRTDDLGSILKSLDYDRSLIDFSSNSPYAAASLLGRIATINYLGSKTTITLKFKKQPGVIAEYLSEAEAATLKLKNYNYFVNYQNDAAILQEGVMADGTFIDSRINADWLANYIQTNVFSLLVRLPKVPQTDEGMSLIVADMTSSLQQAVVNGYLAPGVWNGPSFGTVTTGKFLPLGFEIYAPLVATQNETDRAARKSVPFQIACKEAGAVHSADIMITVNP